MNVQVTTGAASGDRIGFFSAADKLPAGISKAEFSGKPNSTLLLRVDKSRRLLVGIGGGGVTAERYRQAAGTAVRSLLKLGAEKLVIQIDAKARKYAQAIVEGALLAPYLYEEFKSAADRRKTSLKSLVLETSAAGLAEVREQAHAGQILAEATNYVRTLGNRPANVVTPAVLAAEAIVLAKQYRLSCKIWDEKALKTEGFGGIVAVGQGSANPPRFIKLEYHGAARAQAPVIFVGKAITFDTGGISIKPGDRMDEMKFDKMGGCAVLGAMAAVAALKLKVNVVGLIASAENMPGPEAYRPGDLITSLDGKTIEVLNTDAEGRIVLADALAYARIHYRPRAVIDLATLTGACIVALASTRAGLFTRDAALEKALRLAAEETGDKVWPLPVGDEYEEMIRSDIAVAKNTGGREGGASTAASFLKIWADPMPWAHVDIAGPAWITKEKSYLEKGATGFGVRLLVEALKHLK